MLLGPSRGIEFRLMSMQEDSHGGGQDERGSSVPSVARGASQIFAAEPEERGGLPLATWGVAALIVLIVAGALVIFGWKKPAIAPSTLQPADAYAASLPLTQFEMSESENLSGGKQTYIDGHIGNTGSRTVTSVTVQVVFQNDVDLAPQIDTLPLTLIRMKDPYIDIGPVSGDPLKPGDDREFRLTFETVPDNWNQQMPEVRVIHTELH
jgi:hypothetical protein